MSPLRYQRSATDNGLGARQQSSTATQWNATLELDSSAADDEIGKRTLSILAHPLARLLPYTLEGLLWSSATPQAAVQCH